jgi:hypothetical protein
MSMDGFKENLSGPRFPKCGVDGRYNDILEV